MPHGKSGASAEEETCQFPAPAHTHGTHSLPTHIRHPSTLEEAAGSPPRGMDEDVDAPPLPCAVRAGTWMSQH